MINQNTYIKNKPNQNSEKNLDLANLEKSELFKKAINFDKNKINFPMFVISG